MIMGACCVDKVHNMPLGCIMIMGQYYENLSILYRLRYTICYLGCIMLFGAYCVGKVHIMLPQ